MKYRALKKYAFKTGPAGRLLDDLHDLDADLDDALDFKTDKRIDVHIDRLVREQMEKRGTTYQAALKWLRETRPELIVAYDNFKVPVRVYSEDANPGNDPSAEIHEKAMRLIDQQPGLGYSAAAARVLHEDRRLAERYSKFPSCGWDK